MLQRVPTPRKIMLEPLRGGEDKACVLGEGDVFLYASLKTTTGCIAINASGNHGANISHVSTSGSGEDYNTQLAQRQSH